MVCHDKNQVLSGVIEKCGNGRFSNDGWNAATVFPWGTRESLICTIFLTSPINPTNQAFSCSPATWRSSKDIKRRTRQDLVGASDNSGVALGTGKLDWPTIMRRSGQASVKRDLIEVKSTAREQSTGDQTISCCGYGIGHDA